jgi:hypothetical protein
MTKRFLTSAVCVGLLASAPGKVMAQTQEAQTQRTVQGTVQAVDQKARTVTIRGSGGTVVTLDVPPNAERFDQVKVGMTVTGTFYDAVSVRLKPAGEPPVDQTMEPKTTATPGDLPGATRTRQRVTTVTITGWDPVNKVVSFTGPTGTAYTRGLVDTTDPKIVAGLKAGDRVDVTRTEAVTLLVLPSAAPTEDSLKNRLTVSVLFGVDNQFSGTMIKQATGQTINGAAINLDETTFDEVYGRIGIWKVGIGYRTTPRTEGVFNFVWSSSESEETATPIGTVGPGGQIPVSVNFTEYQYWGIEGGQRWFFARTRFTPYVGYLVGLNRHQDIRGTFVNVPANVTPGLADQNGKFFEKSWALSLGPTGGFLIGIGPIELMAEAQLRFLGGLSDVDWLVEESLRDINSESSRWSIPFMAGLRIRF